MWAMRLTLYFSTVAILRFKRASVFFIAVAIVVAAMSLPIFALGPARVGAVGESVGYQVYSLPPSSYGIYNGIESHALNIKKLGVSWDYISDNNYNFNMFWEFGVPLDTVTIDGIDIKVYPTAEPELIKSARLYFGADKQYYYGSVSNKQGLSLAYDSGTIYYTVTLFGVESWFIQLFADNEIFSFYDLLLVDYPAFASETTLAPWDGLDEPTSPIGETGVENILDDGRYDSAVSHVSGLVSDAPFARYQAAFSFLGVAFNNILQKVPVFDDLAKFFAAFAVFNIIFGGFAVAVRAFSNESAREARAQKRKAELDQKITERRRAQMLHDEKLVRSLKKSDKDDK